jgi:hypothetical protein
MSPPSAGAFRFVGVGVVSSTGALPPFFGLPPAWVAAAGCFVKCQFCCLTCFFTCFFTKKHVEQAGTGLSNVLHVKTQKNM